MQQVPSPAPVFRFSVFEVDIVGRELRKQGVLIKLQGQPFQILALFLEHSGEIVTRDEIRRKLWPPDTFIDFEQGLATAIKKLRQALGDDAETPRFIETLPRRGYRFIAPVEKHCSPASASLSDSRSRFSWRPTIVAAALVTPMLLAIGVAVWVIRPRSSGHQAPLTVVPLTTYPGIEYSPSFSPDGSQVAFSWDGENRNNFDIYVKPIGSGPALRLTTDPAADVNPSWSPDGRSIAFHRRLPNNRAAIIEIPALGGPERILTEISIPPSSPFGPFSSWYPDSRWLAVADLLEKPTDGVGSYGIYLVHRDTGVRRLLTRPPPGLIGDSSPAVSPDGRSIVFIRCPGHGLGDLYVAQVSPQLVATGNPKQITFENSAMVSPVWVADGLSILYETVRMSGRCGGSQHPAAKSNGWRPEAKWDRRLPFHSTAIDWHTRGAFSTQTSGAWRYLRGVATNLLP